MAAEKLFVILGSINQNISIVISAVQSTSAVLYFLLDTTFEEEHWKIRVCPERAGKGAGKPHHTGMIEGPGNVKPGK